MERVPSRSYWSSSAEMYEGPAGRPNCFRAACRALREFRGWQQCMRKSGGCGGLPTNLQISPVSGDLAACKALGPSDIAGAQLKQCAPELCTTAS